MKSEPAWKTFPEPKINSRWDNRSRPRTVRVMAVAEGYVLARHSGCVPFATHMSEWHQIYEEKIMPKRQRKGIEKPLGSAPIPQDRETP